MRPPELDVTFRLYELDCKATEDAGSDGDEPYLWVLGFKVDAETLDPGLPPKVNVRVFRGAPASPWVVGAGHVRTGDTVPIQPALGTRAFPLKPALVPLAGWFPGLAGVICLLWDQDGMAPRSSEAGHARFDAKFGGALAGELDKLFAGGYDDALSRDAAGNVVPGTPPVPDLAWRMARLRDTGGRASAIEAITNAIRDSLTSEIEDAVTDVATWDELIDTDDLLGVKAQVYLGDELSGVRDFTLRFTDDGSDYTVRGQVAGQIVHAARILSSVTRVERRLDQVEFVWLKVCWFAAQAYLARAFRLRTTTRFVLDTTVGGPPAHVRWLLDDTVLADGQGTVTVGFEALDAYVSPPQDVLAPQYTGGPAALTYTSNGPVLEIHSDGADGIYFGRVRALYSYDDSPSLYPPPATPLAELLDLGYVREARMSVTGVELSMDSRYYADLGACKKIIDDIDHKHIAVNFGKPHIDPGDPAYDREQVLARVSADVRVLLAAGLESVPEPVLRRAGGPR